MRWLHLTVTAALVVVILIFAVQNLQRVTVSFLHFQLTAPLALQVIVIYVLGMLTGGSAWALLRWVWAGATQAGAPNGETRP